MKKQLLIVALALGFVATTNCGKKSYQLTSGTSITVKSKTRPSVPAGVTVAKSSGNHRWVLTNTNPTGTRPVMIRAKRK